MRRRRLGDPLSGSARAQASCEVGLVDEAGADLLSPRKLRFGARRVWYGDSRMRRARGWTCWWAVLAGFWLLLTDTTKTSELVAGAVAAALAVGSAELVEREGLVV